MITQRVSLKDVRVYAPIGFYEEEQVVGNEFVVNLEVVFPFSQADMEKLENTINYEELYAVVMEVMKPKRKLLESALEDILNITLEKYPFAEEIYVALKKINPPFGGDLATSEVSLTYKKDL